MPTKKAAAKRLKDAEIFTLAAEYERQAEIEGRAKKAKQGVQKSLCEELEARKTTSLTADDGTKVTRVQTENVIVDGDALYGSLTPRQRKLAYDRTLDFGSVPVEVQKALAQLLKDLGYSKAIGHRLNLSALSEAVQSGKIDADVVAEHTDITKNAPYIRISHGTGD